MPIIKYHRNHPKPQTGVNLYHALKQMIIVKAVLTNLVLNDSYACLPQFG